MVNIDSLTKSLTEEIAYIEKYSIATNKNDEFMQNIANVYFDEFDSKLNCILLNAILNKEDLTIIFNEQFDNSNNFYSLLQFRRYLKHLPTKYKNKDYISWVEKKINEIDNSALSLKKLKTKY